jgi:hypothetical protein
MTKAEITKITHQLNASHWILLELKSGLKMKGLFILNDGESLHLNSQRVMATGLIYEGKAGQIPQMQRAKVALSEIVSLEKISARHSNKK